jgi:uncharacterized membrane protein
LLIHQQVLAFQPASGLNESAVPVDVFPDLQEHAYGSKALILLSCPRKGGIQLIWSSASRNPQNAEALKYVPWLAVAVILATDFVLSLGDAAIKQISADFVLWQIFVIRSIIAIPILIALIRVRSRLTSLAPRRFGWVALRSLMLTLMWVAYYAALPHLALGIAAATYYTLPIFITLFAAIFIGERIGPMGWGAVLLGFAGVLLILKPEADGFNGYALLPLVSAVLYALAMILTRAKCREENRLRCGKRDPACRPCSFRENLEAQ